MAQVLIPQNARRYNHNPRGSATAVVTMKGLNPFEGGRRAVIEHPGSALPGMSGLEGLSGLGEAQGATPTAEAGGAMTDILSNIVKAATTVGTTLATARINELYPAQSPQSIPSQGSQQISQSQINTLPLGPQSTVSYPPAPASKLPWILGAVGIAGLGLAFFLSRKKKR